LKLRGRVRVQKHAQIIPQDLYAGKIDFMPKDLRQLMRRPDLLPSGKQDLLSRVAAEAAAMNMPCYLVGGFVRDLLLERRVNDFDVVVEGDAIKLGKALAKKFGGRLTTHEKFKTAIWKYSEEDFLDLITARSEMYEAPGMLPVVRPSTIEQDLKRRDFPINAMAVRLGDKGQLLDPLDGQKDLQAGLIRVLHPKSLIDDPTRIFRAIRYEGRYGFKIEPATLQLVNADSLSVLAKLSGERVRHELDLILGEDGAPQMLKRAGQLGLFDAFDPALPKLNMAHEDSFGAVPSAEFGIAADRVTLGYLLWLMDSSAGLIESLARRLDFTADLRDATLAAVQLQGSLPVLADSRASTWTERLDKVPLVSIHAVWLVTNESPLKDYLTKWRHVRAQTTGDDLRALGIPAGPRYREILHKLRAAWLDNEIKDAVEEANLLKTFTSSSS
jgi:tRNA nucleotidyltransferase (CCA-adding enzyme)